MVSPGICNFGPGIQGCCNQGVRRRNDEGWVHVICPISNASARPRASFFCLFRPPRCTPSLAHETEKRTCAAVYVSIVDETVVESKPKSTFVFLIHGLHQNGFKKIEQIRKTARSLGLWIAWVWSLLLQDNWGIQARPMHFLAPGSNKNRCASQFDRETTTQLIVLECNMVLPLFIAHSYTSTCLCLNLCLHGLFLRTKPLTHRRLRLFILALCWLFPICRGAADSFWGLPHPGRRQSLHFCHGSTDSPSGIGLRTVCWYNGLRLEQLRERVPDRELWGRIVVFIHSAALGSEN